MKRYRVINKRKLETIVVSVHKNLPTDNDVLFKTGWNKKDCIIEEVYSDYHIDENDKPTLIDYLGEEE